MQTETNRKPVNRRTTLAEQSIRKAESEQVEQIDFKMVTFSLGGKDYGIDIMKVAEIAKFANFTYVPNTPHYVRGVYNLRGEIISIIDLRALFNLEFEESEGDEPLDGLIIHTEENTLGVIVDKVARVVGISRSTIQPPHPIFADINLKYIHGVVEHEQRLYIILDVDRIFAREDRRTHSESSGAGSDSIQPAQVTRSSDGGDIGSGSAKSPSVDDDRISFDFVRDTLATFAGFHVTPINDSWIHERFSEWKIQRTNQQKNPQLEAVEDADAFLRPFYSRHSGSFWSQSYIDEFAHCMPQTAPASFTVWNPGCGAGYESYSLAALIRGLYPETRLKVWANDKDLLNISSAPNLVFQATDIPSAFGELVVEGRNGFSFEQSVKEAIVFEYHDILNSNAVPEVDMIVARDVLSFLEPHSQESTIETIREKLKPGGLLIVGEHERLDHYGEWKPVGPNLPGMYRKG